MSTLVADGRWSYIGKIRGGHKFFIEAQTGRLAIADESGTMPSNTDDGPLFVDTNGFITITESYREGYRVGVDLPLLTEDGIKSSTPISLEEAFYLASSAWEMKFMVPHGRKTCIYEVDRTDELPENNPAPEEVDEDYEEQFIT